MNDPTCVLEFRHHASGSASRHSIAFPSAGRRCGLTVLLALGGDLSPARLLMAYRHGDFRGFARRRFCGGRRSARTPCFCRPEKFHLSRSMKLSQRILTA
ncbi:hypothetical protein KCP74_21810 [Salmonella enterica subsp. enterica]|nr:hypothetical protein KCP74_21810 [Salmonella enterica subsp. enterica]